MFERLVEILNRYTDVNPADITGDSLILRDLGLNSYATAEVAGDVEDEFGIEFSDSALMQVRTVGDVMRYIEENRYNSKQQARKGIKCPFRAVRFYRFFSAYFCVSSNVSWAIISSSSVGMTSSLSLLSSVEISTSLPRRAFGSSSIAVPRKPSFSATLVR